MDVVRVIQIPLCSLFQTVLIHSVPVTHACYDYNSESPLVVVYRVLTSGPIPDFLDSPEISGPFHNSL